jgi:type IV secretory pathway TrbF-like protein
VIGFVLLLTGLAAATYGAWRSYVAARSALVPLVREGDPTRRLIEATRPVHVRTRVRVVARNVALSLGWMVVAMYGLYLATVGMAGVR